MEEKKIYSYKEAFEASKKYFGEDELAAKVFVDKYALRDREQNILEDTPVKMFERIATELARIEKKKFKNPMSYEEIYEYIKDFKRIIPQGSPLAGIGNYNQYTTISNCYVVDSPLDSYSSICQIDEEIVQISKRRGGVGLDLSNLRPDGSLTSNAARTSTGVISFMERYSNSIREVAQSGRRGALLLTISVHHPEVVDFAESKKDLKKITGANISIRLTNEFLEAVEKGEKYEQRFPVDAQEKDKKISKMVDAKEVWMKIIKNAWSSAEPGLMMWDNIIKESPADCYSEFGYKTICSNPCNELPLSAYDSCRLLALNLYSYVKNPFTKEAYLDFDLFYKDSQIAQRLMDDFVDYELECVDRILKKINRDPEPIDVKRREKELWEKVKKTCKNGRRTGTGLTALADAIAACGVKYGSKKSIELVEKIYRTLKLGCYRSSVEMSKEIGSFPVWNHELEKDNPFLLRIKDEDEELWKDMKKYGRRNIGLLTSAPCGSISNEAQVSSGIEPVFMLSYVRRKKINHSEKNSRVDFIDNNEDKWQEFEVLHPKVLEWKRITGEEDITKSPWYGCCAEDIDWKNRIKIQAVANKSIDHSISSTINLPENATVEDVSGIYKEAWKQGCKGITVYRKGTRSGVLIDKDEEQSNSITKTIAIKRPKSLKCEVYHVSVNKIPFFVIIGKLNKKDVYEVFAGVNVSGEGEIVIPRTIEKGILKKIKRGKYTLCNSLNENEIIRENISDFIGEEQETITRLISSNLRHGCDISFVVHQLEKTKGDLMGFSKAICRVLKRYTEEDSAVSGEECPECGGELRRVEGCVSCFCGWSKC